VAVQSDDEARALIRAVDALGTYRMGMSRSPQPVADKLAVASAEALAKTNYLWQNRRRIATSRIAPPAKIIADGSGVADDSVVIPTVKKSTA
jgi:hypothetical protein